MIDDQKLEIIKPMWDTVRSTNIRMRKAAVDVTLNAKNLLYMSLDCPSPLQLFISSEHTLI